MENSATSHTKNPLETESIGKGGIGTVVSLSRQVFFLLPLVIVFPLIWGIDDVLWAGPIADGMSGILSLLLVRREMQKW